MGHGQAGTTGWLTKQRQLIVTRTFKKEPNLQRANHLFQVIDRGAITVKENPRFNFWDMADNLTPDLRQRQLHGEDMKCGNQPANIRVINRRFNDPASINDLEIIA